MKKRREWKNVGSNVCSDDGIIIAVSFVNPETGIEQFKTFIGMYIYAREIATALNKYEIRKTYDEHGERVRGGK